MQNKLKIENLQDSNMDDVIHVCSSQRLGDPVHQEGVGLKRLWLKEMLDNYGSCAKVAYYNDKSAAKSSTIQKWLIKQRRLGVKASSS